MSQVCDKLGALLAATPEAGFSQYPVGYCSLPPRLRRLVHENLASLRFSVRYFDLFFIIITRASKTTLLRSATLFANTFARAGKVKPRNSDNMRAPNYCAARKTPIAPSIARARGFALKSRKFVLSAQNKFCEYNQSRKGNRNFPQRNSIWQSFALRKG